MTVATFSNGILDTSNYQGITVRTSAALTASIVYTDWMDVRLFEAIDWIVFLTARGSITRLDMQAQWTTKITPNDTTDWTTLQIEEIASIGVSTLSDYVLRRTITDVITLGISLPVRGRFMRLGIFAGVGSAVGSLCSIDSLRRKPRNT